MQFVPRSDARRRDFNGSFIDQAKGQPGACEQRGQCSIDRVGSLHSRSALPFD